MSGSRNAIDLNMAYDQVSKSAVLTPGSGQQLSLYYAKAQNQSGGTINLGLLLKIAQTDPYLLFGSYVSPGPLTDSTTAINAGTATNIFTTTSNDGFVIQAKKPFNLVGFTVSQAQTGSPVYTYKYYNGSSYTDIPTVYGTPDYSATGDTVLLFPTPRDWAVGSTVGVGGSAALYSIHAQASTAPGQAVKATAFWVGKLIEYAASVPNNGYLDVQWDVTLPKVLDSLEGLLPYFSTSSSSNNVTAQYFSAS